MKAHNWKLSHYRTIYGSFQTIYAPMGTSFELCVPRFQVCLFIHMVGEEHQEPKQMVAEVSPRILR